MNKQRTARRAALRNRADVFAEARARLTIPEAWRMLGLPGEPRPSCRSPFREDCKPSLSIFAGDTRWRDHATGEGGDVVEFARTSLGLGQSKEDWREVARLLARMLGMEPEAPRHAPRAGKPALRPVQGKERPKPPLPKLALSGFSEGGRQDWETVARIRRIRPYAVEVAARLGILRFGQVCGLPCWVLVDGPRTDRPRVAEARRMDGLPFPAAGSLGRRKAHTLKGSGKSWPLGASLLAENPSAAALLVEGGPDWLAALHFLANARKAGVVPVAMLGRSNRIAPEALPLFAGRRVRICPHEDKDGGGMEAARRWAAQLAAVDCGVDAFVFSGLLREDGQPVRDLNDCTSIRPEDEPQLENILP